MMSVPKQETQPKPRLIVRLGIFLASHHILFSVLCCSAGIITLLLLPSLAKNTYLSENALIPGSANPLFSTEDAIEANRFMKGIKAVAGDSRGEIMANFIAQQIEALGAEVCYHKFIPHSKNFHPLKFFTSMTNDMAIQPNGTDRIFGINTIGIVRAPRGDGKEAIVLVSPYNSQRVQSNELLSLALGFSVFSLLSRAAWLSKDVVWLSADSQFGEYAAVSAWLNQYHNPVVLSQYGANHIYDGNSEKTEVKAFKRAGTMAAALIFKVGETRRYGDRDSVTMYAEASNGQMPNLDLLNVVHYLAVQRQGFHVNIAAFSSVLSSAWLRVIAEFLHTVGSVLMKINPNWKLDIAVPDYVEGTANLANSLYNQALGVPTGSHGAFRDYQVDAVSLEFSPTFHVRNENAKSLFLLRGGRLIEGVVRSVNNLLEKFHQSFFLYFLTAPSKFISVGVYMVPFALLLAPLPIVAAALADGSRSMEKVDKLIEHGKADGNADIPQSKGGSCKWLQAAKVLLVIQLWAVLVSLLPYYITQIPDATPMQSALIWAVLSIVILIALSVVFGSPYSAGVEWKLVKATMITSISIGLGLMSIINFATAQIGALIVIPMCLFSRPLKASGMNFLPRAVLLASNIVFAVLGFPPAAVLIRKGVSKGLCSWTTDFGDFWIWMEFLWESSSATYLYLYLVHLPCWLLCILVLLHPCRQLESKVKQD